ncbi:glycosyl hydrolase 115 family protein [Isoptericola chiayiensis]|uniref:Glycosyl hydrolase 115 family protein n=1 Tax=Isoptericola chiayiensis TaxID=579446 RepID=A0ABP8Y9L9_9MICO|nr:glycosyl hydrolase 115 family protein [Isoptericola chiayiensis]NOW01994.1 hypothetical protein [Isoptericola chiayiensis]
MSYVIADPDGLRIAAPDVTTTVAVDPGEDSAVLLAVDDLVTDLARVCPGAVVERATPDAGADAARAATVVVGTLDSPLVAAAVADGTLDVACLRDDDGAPVWEAFLVAAAGDSLYVVGGDRRGAVYGVYDLSERAGVSPWHWFADVPVTARPHLTVARDTRHTDHPSVQYRGIFLNDEEELDAWAARHTPDGTIGPALYARVFELILRLKGNYLWPAMHVNAFNADPTNGRLAHERGVVIGTSHCDMLLRSNEHEWKPWLAAQDEHVEYDYSIPGRNRELLGEYWRSSIRQNRDYEVGWTFGMRGIHDSGFHTRAIDTDEHLSDAEKHRARVRLLSRIIADQRGLLADGIGDERARDALQCFVPYKEVLPLYDDGLDIPEDVTLIWADDSFGTVRRFPTPAERERPGGHGLYYHSSYWSPAPRSYLFLSSMPLAHMKNELCKSWDRGIRTLWVNNVGSLKPLEQDTEFFLRHAWEVGKETTTADVEAWTAQWVDRDFSGGIGSRAAAMLTEWAQVTNVRKVEHLTPRAFDLTAFGDEAARRLDRLRALAEEATDLWAGLPEDERDAFVQMVLLKVHAAWLMSAQFAHGDRSALAAAQGKAAAADHHLAVSRAFDRAKKALIRSYNTVIAGGKWDGLMTPEEFPPPGMPLHPAARPALRVAGDGIGVTVWGGPGIDGVDDGGTPADGGSPAAVPVLRFDPHGTPTRWIEVFPTGAAPVDVTLEADPWLELGTTRVTTATEQRVAVRVPDVAAAAGRTGTVVLRGTDGVVRATVTVRVADAPPAPDEPCALEADGYVSLAADTPHARRDTPGTRWAVVEHLGRGGGGLLEARGQAPAGDPATVATQGCVDYRVHLDTPGAHVLELHRSPSLDSAGRIRVGVAVDDAPPVVVETTTTDEYRGDWTDVVVEGVDRLTVRLPYLEAGVHTLRLHVVDEWFALSALVLWTGSRRSTALPPPASTRTEAPRTRPADPDPDVDLTALAATARRVYGVDPADVPLLPTVHVPRTYWDTPTTFTRNQTVETRLAPPRDLTGPDGTKDVLAALPTGVPRETGGALALDVERALLDSRDAWTTTSLDAPRTGWTHTQAETWGRTGLALHVHARRRWDDLTTAPGLHLRVRADGGTYRAWALVCFTSDDDDGLALAVDGTVQPPSEQFCGGSMFSFGTAQEWVWHEVSDLHLGAGEHVLSVLARKAGFRVARLYLTRDEARPPVDADWVPSPCEGRTP